MIVTIDGPAGSGKSTAAQKLAEQLGFEFLDTGAMYRVVALACLRHGINIDDTGAVAHQAQGIKMQLTDGRVVADNADVTEEIRTVDVTQAASVVAVIPDVRHVLAERQRELAHGRDIITEGRDQGTFVFPEADCKFFLTADPAERAVRRQKEFEGKGLHVPLDEIQAQIDERDKRDQTRKVAPLVPAEDAVQIDTSSMTTDDVVTFLVETVRRVDDR